MILRLILLCKAASPSKQPFARSIIKFTIYFFLLQMLIIISLRWLNPPTTTVILSEKLLSKQEIYHEWIKIGDLKQNIPLAIVAAEDSGFCNHNGFEISEIIKARKSGSLRGASTISQQVAKNLFLWRDRSWVRKGIEAFVTIQLELFLPKRRILELYLNIAETGPGHFGVATISKKRFNKHPGDLSLKEASRLAVTFPNPKVRNANKLSSNLKIKARKIQTGAETLKIDGRASCFLTT